MYKAKIKNKILACTLALSLVATLGCTTPVQAAEPNLVAVSENDIAEVVAVEEETVTEVAEDEVTVEADVTEESADVELKEEASIMLEMNQTVTGQKLSSIDDIHRYTMNIPKAGMYCLKFNKNAASAPGTYFICVSVRNRAGIALYAESFHQSLDGEKHFYIETPGIYTVRVTTGANYADAFNFDAESRVGSVYDITLTEKPLGDGVPSASMEVRPELNKKYEVLVDVIRSDVRYRIVLPNDGYVSIWTTATKGLNGMMIFKFQGKEFYHLCAEGTESTTQKVFLKKGEYMLETNLMSVIGAESTYGLKINYESVNHDNIEAFVGRMYTEALGREAEAAGLQDWSNQLEIGKIDGAGIAGGFIGSDEFKNRNLSNSAYVDTLYQTFFNRNADAGGKANWMNVLANGGSRNDVLVGFVNSTEFSNLCDEYGIARGTMQADGSSVYKQGVRDYVLRMYTVALNRDGETLGVEDWSNRINTGTMDAEDVAKSFFNSEEFINRDLSNEEYVETLYETFMDRASDEAGKADWVGRLAAGTSRQEVLEGFSRSREFRNIMRGYGL